MTAVILPTANEPDIAESFVEGLPCGLSVRYARTMDDVLAAALPDAAGGRGPVEVDRVDRRDMTVAHPSAREGPVGDVSRAACVSGSGTLGTSARCAEPTPGDWNGDRRRLRARARRRSAHRPRPRGGRPRWAAADVIAALDARRAAAEDLTVALVDLLYLVEHAKRENPGVWGRATAEARGETAAARRLAELAGQPAQWRSIEVKCTCWPAKGGTGIGPT